MSEPMDLTSPARGRIYARSSQSSIVPEPRVPPWVTYPAIPPHISGPLPQPLCPAFPHLTSNSVPPYLHTANRRLQSLHSPPIISPLVSLPNINSVVVDNSFYVNHPRNQGPFTVPRVFCRSPTNSLHQPPQIASPGLSYVTAQPSIAAPVLHAPIADLNHSFHNPSHTASLQPYHTSPHFHSIAITGVELPEYAPAIRSPTHEPSRLRYNHFHTPLCTPSVNASSHFSHPISHLSPHSHTPLTNDIHHIPNDFAPRPLLINLLLFLLPKMYQNWLGKATGAPGTQLLPPSSRTNKSLAIFLTAWLLEHNMTLRSFHHIHLLSNPTLCNRTLTNLLTGGQWTE